MTDPLDQLDLFAAPRPAPDEPSRWALDNARTRQDGGHFLAFAIVHQPRYRTIAAAYEAWADG